MGRTIKEGFPEEVVTELCEKEDRSLLTVKEERVCMDHKIIPHLF